MRRKHFIFEKSSCTVCCFQCLCVVSSKLWYYISPIYCTAENTLSLYRTNIHPPCLLAFFDDWRSKKRGHPIRACGRLSFNLFHLSISFPKHTKNTTSYSEPYGRRVQPGDIIGVMMDLPDKAISKSLSPSLPVPLTFPFMALNNNICSVFLARQKCTSSFIKFLAFLINLFNPTKCTEKGFGAILPKEKNGV